MLAPTRSEDTADRRDVRELGLKEATLNDPARLAALRATGLLDSEVEEVFDRLTRLGVRLLGVPAAFISLVDADRDFYKSSCGFGEPLASARQLAGPTFCHHTVQRTSPLIIPDTAGDPVYRDVPSVRTLGVAAYVGIPLSVDGQNIGALCAIDTRPRNWTTDEVDTLVELAASAQREIELRGAVAKGHATMLALESKRAELEERTQEAEAANKAKSGFLSMMSHELRTPLNAITGYADLLSMEVRGAVNPDQLDYLNRIMRASRHLQGLIGELLEFARLDAGRMEYATSELSIDAILTEAIELTMPQIAERGIVFTREECQSDDPSHSHRAIGDPDKVRQIFINLLTNAVKFTPQGGRVWVKCNTRVSLFGIQVSDAGRGIPQDRLATVFEPFVQIDRESTSPRFQGVGLGLAICRELARGMNGDLVVESELGVGSTFTLLLPAA